VGGRTGVLGAGVPGVVARGAWWWSWGGSSTWMTSWARCSWDRGVGLSLPFVAPPPVLFVSLVLGSSGSAADPEVASVVVSGLWSQDRTVTAPITTTTATAGRDGQCPPQPAVALPEPGPGARVVVRVGLSAAGRRAGTGAHARTHRIERRCLGLAHLAAARRRGGPGPARGPGRLAHARAQGRRRRGQRGREPGAHGAQRGRAERQGGAHAEAVGLRGEQRGAVGHRGARLGIDHCGQVRCRGDPLRQAVEPCGAAHDHGHVEIGGDQAGRDQGRGHGVDRVQHRCARTTAPRHGRALDAGDPGHAGARG
jgi:hypothetical protein